MSQVEHVVLKGDKQGVSILIRDGVELATALEELRRKVAPARSFFVGAPVRVAVGGRDLLPDELQTLAAAVGELGLTLVHPVEKVLMRRSGSPAPGSDEKTSAGDAALLHKKTLRSGQRIDHDGNVVILGDVNPGAVVTCTGDIVVMGTLRGVAHAGAAGDVRAVVVAFRLEPTQLRIANMISRAPDGVVQHPAGPEVALIKDVSILFEAYTP